MKVQKLGCVAIALVAMVNTASAADRPSQATLAAMGLGGLVAMDDADALAIRGHGFKGGKGGSSARAWGSSYAHISGHGGSAASQNGYDAKGRHVAAGGNLSFAGIVVVQSGGGHNGGMGPAKKSGKGSKGGGYGGGGHGGGAPKVKSVTVFAGGGSFAFAD